MAGMAYFLEIHLFDFVSIWHWESEVNAIMALFVSWKGFCFDYGEN